MKDSVKLSSGERIRLEPSERYRVEFPNIYVFIDGAWKKLGEVKSLSHVPGNIVRR